MIHSAPFTYLHYTTAASVGVCVCILRLRRRPRQSQSQSQSRLLRLLRLRLRLRFFLCADLFTLINLGVGEKIPLNTDSVASLRRRVLE